MKRRLLKLARDTKRAAVQFKPGARPPVAIFGIRRGGSTMLADMIAGEQGMWFIDEPFGAFAPAKEFYDVIRAQLPERPHNQFFDMNDEERQAVHRFMARMLSLDLRIGAVRRAGFPPTANRVALKILNTPLLVDELIEAFGLRSVLLTRHPAAQARSVLRLGWGFSAEAYFASDAFCAGHFSPEQTREGRAILAGEDDWSKAILNWVIESWVPLTESNPETPRVAYETIVTERESIVRGLFAYLELDEVERALESLGRPSNSSSMSTDSSKGAIASGDTQAIVGSWLDRVTTDERARGQAILDLFGVDLYRMDDPMPTRALFELKESV